MVENLEKELEQMNDGIWRWNFIKGNKYNLGYHHGNGLGLFGEEVHGTFIGKIRGHNVFINMEDDAIRCYSGTSNNAYWIGEPDEGPYWPTAMVNYDGEAKDEKLKEFISRRLRRIEFIKKEKSKRE